MSLVDTETGEVIVLMDEDEARKITAEKRAAEDALLAGRIFSRIEVDPAAECWLWTGATLTGPSGGYGQIAVAGRPVLVHRLVYELTWGSVPAGAHLDHTCHNVDLSCPGGGACSHRRCCNPEHLDPVTNRENVLRSPVAAAAINARKTHCVNGHPFDEANTRIYVRRDGRARRECRACDNGRPRRGSRA